MNPMVSPDAPRLWAYPGSSGTTMPCPSIERNIERKSVENIFQSMVKEFPPEYKFFLFFTMGMYIWFCQETSR
jgi:hypothetical protein